MEKNIQKAVQSALDEYIGVPMTASVEAEIVEKVRLLLTTFSASRGIRVTIDRNASVLTDGTLRVELSARSGSDPTG